jgi:hypothetical protein
VGRAIRSSSFYGWLVTEPEPEIIVIDLRETRTIAPLIAVVDWSGRQFALARPRSVVLGIGASLNRIIMSALIHISAGLLAIAILIYLFS